MRSGFPLVSKGMAKADLARIVCSITASEDLHGRATTFEAVVTLPG